MSSTLNFNAQRSESLKRSCYSATQSWSSSNMNIALTRSSLSSVRKQKFYLQHRERQLDLNALMLLTCICSILCAKNAPAIIAVNIETLHSTFGSFETKSRVNVCFYLLVPSSSLLKALVAGMEPFWKKKINGVLHCFL